MPSDSSNNKPLLCHLSIQVDLLCPTHATTSDPSSEKVRKLPVFKARVYSARETRRNITDIIKRHIPSLKSFDTLTTSFRVPVQGKAANLSPKAIFESVITKAVNSGEVLYLLVRPSSNNSSQNKSCFCPEPAPAVPAAPQTESLYRQYHQQLASQDISEVTPATITSGHQGLRKIGELIAQGTLTDQVEEQYHEAIKARRETDKKIAFDIAKYECVLARLKELELEHKALQENSQKHKAEVAETKALYDFALDKIRNVEAENKALYGKAQELEETARKAKATESTRPAAATSGSTGGQFQAFAHDLLENLNSSMSANFGDALGTFHFAPSSPVIPGVAEPHQHHFAPRQQYSAMPTTCVPRTHPRIEVAPVPDHTPAQAPRLPPSSYPSGPDAIPLPGASFYCDICRRLSSGEDRYRCLRCDDWDACANCCLYGLHEHEHSAFLFLPANPMNKRADAAESPLSTSCVGCPFESPIGELYYYNSPSSPEQKLAYCQKCFLDFTSSGYRPFSNRRSTIKAGDYVVVHTQSGEANEPPLHLIRTRLARFPRPATVDEVKDCNSRSLQHHCDLCSATIDAKNEWRYHCARCKDWDVCMRCWDSRKADLHHHPHFIEFAPTENSGSCGSGGPPAAPQPLSADPCNGVWPVPVAAVRAPQTQPYFPQPLRHNATCDLCQEGITGPRLKCLDCPDWDSCSKPTCAGQLPIRHPGHRFVQMDDPGQLRYHHRHFFARQSPRQYKHMGIFCDGCDAPITGTRYACIGCADFDLCANCEALPVTNLAVLEQKKGVKNTKATAGSHQHEHGAHHLFVKITGESALQNGSASFFASNKNVKIGNVLHRARSAVSSSLSDTEDNSEKNAFTEAASTTVPTEDPPHYPCGTSLYAAYLADEAEAKKNRDEQEKTAAASKAKREAEKQSEAFKAAAGDNVFEQTAASFGAMTVTDVLRTLASTPLAGAAAKAPGAGPARRFLQEMFPLSSSTTNLPQTRPAPCDSTKDAESSEATSAEKAKASRGPVSVVHSMEPPKNQQLSYEEKRTLSVRVERGGEAAVHAFLSALTQDQLEEVTADGELVFELDDLSAEQYYNIMTELDALELSRKEADAAAAEAVAEKEAIGSSSTAAEAVLAAEEEKNVPAQMAELSSSFKTIRNAAPSNQKSASSVSSVTDSKTASEPVEDKRLDLDAAFVEDVSLPDGAVIAAGSRFDKIWRLRNSGKKPWPAGVRLKYVAGDSMDLKQSAGSAIPTSQLSSSPSSLDNLPPGAECQIRLSALKAMEITGRSTAYFRLSAPGRSPYSGDIAFGHQLWIDIDVRAGEDDAVAAGNTAAAAVGPAPTEATSELGSQSSPEHSVGRLGGSSVFTAPHAPESVRSDAGASAVADATPAAEMTAGDQSVTKKAKTLRGFRLDDESESESEDENPNHAGGDRNPFEDAVGGGASDDEDGSYVSGHALDDVSDDSDFELVDPTTEEESDVE